jgi:hypothetical protein
LKHFSHRVQWENVQMPSSQKLQIWLKPNCTWMFIGWFSTILRFFVPIWNSKWRHPRVVYSCGWCCAFCKKWIARTEYKFCVLMPFARYEHYPYHNQ